MKIFLFVLGSFINCFSIAQNSYLNKSSIHSTSLNEENDPALLAKILTAGLVTETDKVRSIYAWITEHIAYNTNAFSKAPQKNVISLTTDTLSEWKSGEEMTARKVLLRRSAVCEGYAKLFKVLCNYAGIKSEVVMGYAKNYMDGNLKFRTNHSWNAVMIDSSWHLLDVTWASGYVNSANEYVQRTDDNYFLTSPQKFITDHYPEDLRWTLLENPPALHEFKVSPFRFKSIVKYGISSFSPSSGIIEANTGDTITIEIQLKYPLKDKQISADPFFDSTLLTGLSFSAFLCPRIEKNIARYQYIVPENPARWIHLFYNDDLILKYYLRVNNSPRN